MSGEAGGDDDCAQMAAAPLGGGSRLYSQTHNKNYHSPRVLPESSVSRITGYGQQHLQNHFKSGTAELKHGDYTYRVHKAAAGESSPTAEGWLKDAHMGRRSMGTGAGRPLGAPGPKPMNLGSGNGQSDKTVPVQKGAGFGSPASTFTPSADIKAKKAATVAVSPNMGNMDFPKP